LTEEQASTVASSAGLEIAFEPEFSESVPAGVVISSRPGPGDKVVSGGEIAAVLSKGPERYAMPRVVGLTEKAAVSALNSANLELGRAKADYSATVPEGSVIKASQATGALLKKQSLVYLTISQGPRPIKIVNYKNKPADDATAALEQAGFTVSVETSNSAKVPSGLVISQSPSKGKGKAGDTITLNKSIGPVMVTVPFVKRMGVRAATRVLQSAGFKVKTKSAPFGIGLGYVAYTRPGARAKAPQGSTITLYLV
jgi:serine/threonine-protein kinase